MAFVNAFTKEQGLALLATQPDVVKSLSKADDNYREWFISLGNIAGVSNIETLESNGSFDVNGESVSFTTLAFVALSSMSLRGFGPSNNTKTQPLLTDVVVTANLVVKSITDASDGKYYFYDKEPEIGYTGLRLFVETLLQGHTVAEAQELLGEKFAELQAKGDAIRLAKALAKASK